MRPLTIVILGLFPSPERCVCHFAQEKHCASLLGTGSGLPLLQVSLQMLSIQSAFCKPYPMHLYSCEKAAYVSYHAASGTYIPSGLHCPLIISRLIVIK